MPGAPLIPTDKFGRALVVLDPNGRPLRDPQGTYIPIPQPKRLTPTPAPAPKPEPMTAPDEADTGATRAPELPSFAGMGVSRALDEARKLHLDVEMTGTGTVVSQDVIGAGKIKLVFSDDARRNQAPLGELTSASP